MVFPFVVLSLNVYSYRTMGLYVERIAKSKFVMVSFALVLFIFFGLECFKTAKLRA
jgi:hypothetical protein